MIVIFSVNFDELVGASQLFKKLLYDVYCSKFIEQNDIFFLEAELKQSNNELCFIDIEWGEILDGN